VLTEEGFCDLIISLLLLEECEEDKEEEDEAV
jgi:hypothetical protein